MINSDVSLFITVFKMRLMPFSFDLWKKKMWCMIMIKRIANCKYDCFKKIFTVKLSKYNYLFVGLLRII